VPIVANPTTAAAEWLRSNGYVPRGGRPTLAGLVPGERRIAVYHRTGHGEGDGCVGQVVGIGAQGVESEGREVEPGGGHFAEQRAQPGRPDGDRLPRRRACAISGALPAMSHVLWLCRSPWNVSPGLIGTVRTRWAGLIFVAVDRGFEDACVGGTERASLFLGARVLPSCGKVFPLPPGWPVRPRVRVGR
jgi:hypothetical protein